MNDYDERVERLQMDFYDEMIAAGERGEHMPVYPRWLESRVIRNADYAANELDTLRAENARLVGLVGALRGEIALTRAFVEGVALAIVNAKRLTKETCLRQITQISDKLSQMLGESEETE